MVRISESTIIIILAMLNLITFILIDESIALTVYGILFLTWIVLQSDVKKHFPFEREGGILKPLLISVGVTIGFFFILSIILGSIGAGNLNASMEFYASTIPQFKESLIFIFVAFGFLITMAETSMLAKLADFASDKVKGGLTLTNPVAWGILLIFITFFTILHIAAKLTVSATATQFDSALISVFLFGLVTYILIIVRKQWKEAALFHIIANITALIIAYGLLVSVGLPLIIGIAIALILLFIKEKLNIRIISGG